ncbi:hypothetical protein COV18_02570 [Candidatus Woesearchaeota archaeon CG10_big_fil_rev_8_21_14_0_10_37_12]|nr:MAG: hypothetical protein COV18_02570 [Candidatus Woesearchaeota archaeon CG10_big_fil_rev_8_21_14_0_10_37_12]
MGWLLESFLNSAIYRVYMNAEVLEKIGLTKGESRAYVALLKLGKSSVGIIINEANISRSKIYDVLDRLISKGLVSIVTEGKIKHFTAIPPKRIHEFLEQQKQELEKREEALKMITPQLEKLPLLQTNTSAEILSGPRGIKTFFDMSLYDNSKKEEILVLGYSKEASLYFHAYFRKHHKERTRKKIPGRVIYDYETWFLKNREKRTYVEQRYLPKDMKTPAFIYLFGDVIGTIVFTKQQKLCFMIKNKMVAESYTAYFNILWKQAIKTGK